MSLHASNKYKYQHENQASAQKAIINPKYKLQSKYLMAVGYTLILSSTAFAMAGCQSSNTLASPTHVSDTLIDFTTANTAQNQAQSKAFNAKLMANSERYQQLFDQDKYPNTETQAKTRLLTAIRQHLATEHVSVSQTNYHSMPFIKADSIDAGSTSFLRTLLELYLDKNSEAEEDYDYDYDEAEAEAEVEEDDNSEEDEYTEVMDNMADVVEVVAEEYDEEGYDTYGYNEYGYDQNGYDEYGYDEDGYDEYGHHQDDYDYDYDDEYESKQERLLSKLSSLNPKNLLNDYEDMQASKQLKAMQEKNSTQVYQGSLSQVMHMFTRTPEQVEALNAYQNQYLTFSSISQYKPKQKQTQSVYSYDYVAPTVSLSMQIPWALDFDNSQITLDPSALLPLVALANSEHAPLPTQMTSHTVNFGLPDNITSQIPSAVIYDAVIAALENSMAELDPNYFSAVDIREDKFAKQVGADRAVKVYFGSRQSGEMIGKMFKNISRSLQIHIDAHPDKYPDEAPLKQAIAKIENYNKGYQSGDVGSLLQFIEAVSPISFNHTNYYYLDKSDRLLAKQQHVNLGSDFLGLQSSLLNQTRYDAASFNKHTLTPLFIESFGPKATPAIDGNAWLTQQRQNKARLDKASDARYDYIEAVEASADYEDSYENNDSHEYAIDEDDVGSYAEDDSEDDSENERESSD